MVAKFEWKSVSYEPGNINVPILAWTKNNKLMVFKDTKSYICGNPNPYSNWKWLAEKYNIKFWAYQSEVINEHPYDYGD